MKLFKIIILLLFCVVLNSCFLNKGGVYTVKDVRAVNDHPVVKLKHYSGWYNLYGYGKDSLNFPDINQAIVITVKQHKPKTSESGSNIISSKISYAIK